jgi:hypothetical protein
MVLLVIVPTNIFSCPKQALSRAWITFATQLSLSTKKNTSASQMPTMWSAFLKLVQAEDSQACLDQLIACTGGEIIARLLERKSQIFIII